MDDTRFGILLLENPFIRGEDVERCLQIQALGGWRRPIGEILLEEGVISEATLRLVLELQERRRRAARPAGASPWQDSAIPGVGELIARARGRQATDILLAQGRRPRARVGGRLVALSDAVLPSAWLQSFARDVLDAGQRQTFVRGRQVTARLGPGEDRACRCTFFLDCQGPAAAIRLAPSALPTLSELGHPDAVERLLDSRSGLILVGGGPRSGKSTTIAAMVEHLTRHARHIVVHDEHHQHTFAPGPGLVTPKPVSHEPERLAHVLGQSFREDPDVIVVGDLVGRASIELCLQIASTGHLVVAGIRSPTTVALLQQLETGVDEQALPHLRRDLASRLLGIVFQELVPAAEAGRGLVLASEIVLATRALRAAIAAGSFERIPMLLAHENDHGCRAMDDCLMDLVESDAIAIEEAFARARDRHRFLMTAG